MHLMIHFICSKECTHSGRIYKVGDAWHLNPVRMHNDNVRTLDEFIEEYTEDIDGRNWVIDRQLSIISNMEELLCCR